MEDSRGGAAAEAVRAAGTDPVIFQRRSRRACAISRVYDTSDANRFRTRTVGLTKRYSLSVIAIQHLHHEVCGFEI